MFVVQEGRVEVLQNRQGQEVQLAVMGPGDFFGEMALFEREVRSATVRALGEARVLTVDKRTFLRRVHEDPSLAYRLVQTMSQRIRRLNADLAQTQGPAGQ
jgi:CRP-like cAMP-binding protein